MTGAAVTVCVGLVATAVVYGWRGRNAFRAARRERVLFWESAAAVSDRPGLFADRESWYLATSALLLDMAEDLETNAARLFEPGDTVTEFDVDANRQYFERVAFELRVIAQNLATPAGEPLIEIGEEGGTDDG